jgi:hypothetical protein
MGLCDRQVHVVGPVSQPFPHNAPVRAATPRAGEEGFEPSNSGSKVRLSLGGRNVNSLLEKELPVIGGHREAPAGGSIASKTASIATA